MNTKKKLLVVVLVLMMMFTAVAYAAWSDQIDVNGTATTGTFDVQWSETPGDFSATVNNNNKNPGFTTGNDLYIYLEKDASNQSNDKVTFGFLKGEPGETYTFTFKAVNKGSVQAKLTSPASLPISDDNFIIEYSSSFTNNHVLTPLNTETFSVTITVKENAAQSATKAITIPLPYVQNIDSN